eukprot:4457829-Pyramimonas_sp.AAC.1
MDSLSAHGGRDYFVDCAPPGFVTSADYAAGVCWRQRRDGAAAGERLRVANGYRGFSPTHCGPRGETSWVDTIVAPTALVQHCRSAGPLHRLSRELQYVRRKAVSEHLFIHMAFDYVFHPQA